MPASSPLARPPPPGYGGHIAEEGAVAVLEGRRARPSGWRHTGHRNANFNNKGWIATSAASGRIRGIPQTDHVKVVERLTRVAKDTIRYAATIEDPEIYTRPWTVSFPLTEDPDYRIYDTPVTKATTRWRTFFVAPAPPTPPQRRRNQLHSSSPSHGTNRDRRTLFETCGRILSCGALNYGRGRALGV